MSESKATHDKNKTSKNQNSLDLKFDKADQNLKARLTPEQYHVTQECGTEPPFQNLYWNNPKHGLYVDLITGEPLFTSLDKYDSGTGWPSFTKPVADDVVTSHTDDSLQSFYGPRTEIKSKTSGSHLGHVFDDGPKDRGGKRYCMNSSALRFIPIEDLEKEGYGSYLKLFEGI